MSTSTTASFGWRDALCRIVLIVWAANAGIAVPAMAADNPAAASASMRADGVTLANAILDRWEPVAMKAGVHSSAWREIFATQLTAMDLSTLHGIDHVAVSTGDDATASYAQFAQAIRGAEMRWAKLASPGKGPTKLGSTITDQVFVPITPCRIVDTRNVGGPILAGTTRNFFFYSTGSADDWSGQGGVAGPSGSTCPGTILPNGGTNSASAAVVTVTVVNPTAAGNWVIWGGADPRPEISALNWNAGDVAANTTVIPGGGRTGSGPGGGVKDFAVRYNGPTGSAQFVADVVGYLVENQATALDCYETPLASQSIAFGQSASVAAMACSAGWTLVGGDCDSDNYQQMYMNAQYYIGPFPQAHWTCTYYSLVNGLPQIYATSICCRVPGR